MVAACRAGDANFSKVSGLFFVSEVHVLPVLFCPWTLVCLCDIGCFSFL